MQRSVGKSRRQAWLGIALSALSLGAILLLIDPAEIIEAFLSADFGYLIFCAVGILLFLVIRAYRWRYLLEYGGPAAPVFHIQNVGYMLSNILPLRLGDVARAVLIGKLPSVSISQGFATLVVERVFDMLFFVALMPLSFSAATRLPDWMGSAAVYVGSATAAALFVLILLAKRRAAAVRALTSMANLFPVDTDALAARSEKILDGLNSLADSWRLVKLVAYTVLTWLPILFAYSMALRAVKLESSLAAAGFVLCAAALSVAAPSSPGQIGIFHAGVIAGLRILGQPESESAAFAFLYHAINVSMMIVMGAIGLSMTGSTLRQVMNSTQGYFRQD